MGKYPNHVEQWCDCVKCGLCHQRRNVVLGRGILPCEVLIVGEAPGESEDVLGTPFIGTAGRLLSNQIIPQAVSLCGEFSIAVTNLVACAPWEDRLSSKTRDPQKEEIEACSPRLQEFIDMANAKVIVTLGELAAKWVPKMQCNKAYLLKLPHPAALTRIKTQAQKSFAVRQCAVRIASAVAYVRRKE